MTTELRTEVMESLQAVRQEMNTINARITHLEGIEAASPTQNTVSTVAELHRFMLAAQVVPAQIKVIEDKIQKMEQSRSDKNRGVEQLFDGKNAKMVPDTFEKEQPNKSFRAWQSKVRLFIELADKEAGQLIRKQLMRS